MFFFLPCVCYVFVHVFLFVLVGTYWKRAGLLALVCGVSLQVCHLQIGILGQVWYLIVSIPDLCTLTYFYLFSLLHNVLIEFNNTWTKCKSPYEINPSERHNFQIVFTSSLLNNVLLQVKQLISQCMKYNLMDT